MRIALVGTRGVPARYGGFETAVEEVGRRLVARGHDVTVYCRRLDQARGTTPQSYEGMRLIHLPAWRSRSLETLSHTLLSLSDLVLRRNVDAVIVFNAANAVLLPLLRLRRIPVATHVDGLEWRRGKWGRLGRTYYRVAEALAVRWSDDLIADARGIAAYYEEEFGAATTEITYGAPIIENLPTDGLDEFELEPNGYHLVVARFEPENHVDMIIAAHNRSRATLPLVVVGSAPYGGAHIDRIQQLAEGQPMVRLVGAVWDQKQLDQLYAHALTYIHGHSVGGTNPSLLRAMGAKTASIAYDVNFNHDVLGEDGRFFGDASTLSGEIESAERHVDVTHARGRALAARAATVYTWARVTQRYEQLCTDLAAGKSQRGAYSGRRNAATIRRHVPAATVAPEQLVTTGP